MLRETVANAARRIGETAGVNARTWEDLKVGGKFIVSEIIRAIDAADVAVFEVTDLNQNVMFELGYAIGSEKRVWLLRDTTDELADRRWKQVRVLATVGYTPYTNSDDIRVSFLRERPYQGGQTIFEEAIAPSLQPALFASLLYVTSPHNSEAERDLRRRVQQETRNGLSVMVEDAAESAVQPLTWYAQQIYGAAATIVHFVSPRRRESDVHNARSAFVAGLAHGMQIPLLMVAQEEYPAPIDYQDLLYVYKTARDCVSYVDRWLTSNLSGAHSEQRDVEVRKRRLHLATELRSLRLGDHVAEKEADVLYEYFVETAAFDEVLASKAMIFVGRKGTGKTANLIRATEILADDKRRLVVPITPFGYELESIVRLFQKFGSRDAQDFVVEALWKFLLVSEVALAAVAEIEERITPPLPGSPEHELTDYVNGEGEFLTLDFAVRLERAIDSLMELEPNESVADERARITQALHERPIANLRRLLGPVLEKRTQVAILVDNLDQPWDRNSDLDVLSTFLLGLLTGVARLESDFSRSDSWRRPVPLTVGVFLRTDIFSRIVRVAREPDKIPFARIVWDDPELLLRVVEERYVAARDGEAAPDELWQKYFDSHVRGLVTTDYIVRRILPRPRDIVYFCNAAITVAINRRHGKIHADDILEAEKVYSQFAFEALLVEGTSLGIDLEGVLYEFAGGDAIVSREEVNDALMRAGVSESDAEETLELLRSLSFLGVEVKDGEYEYVEDSRDMRRSDALARRLAERRGVSSRYRIHPAFRPFLDIEDSSDPLMS